MRIRVLAVGTRMPDWVNTGVKEYQKRLPREWRFEWLELPLGPRGRSQGGKSQDNSKAILAEGKSMLAAIDKNDKVIALEVKGKNWSTEQVSKELSSWQMSGQDIVILIGGPDGLAQSCIDRASQYWSLSALTLPHPLVRIILTEQLYRGWTLLNNHPYHK
ncbi:MAG: 23S rRNA (pseudouridine(1915)-N(3))-methyltransferase RlmH [Cellvibrionaceae bacterium]